MRGERRSFSPVVAVLLLALLTGPGRLSAQDTTATRLREAARFLASGNLGSAENELNLVLRGSPDEYRALDLLGVVRVLQRRESDAEHLFRRVVQSKPGFASGHAHLGLLLLETDRSEEAVPELGEAVRLDPSRTDASEALVHIWREQAQTASRAGDYAKAVGLLAEARKLAPHNADVQLEFGDAALQMSLLKDAVEGFQQTLRLRRNDPMALYGLGRALMGLSQFEGARQQFALYVDVRPDDWAGHCALGMTLAALERAPEARTQFKRSLALDPGQIESYFRLGLLDINSNDLQSAGKNLRTLLDRDPKHAGALAALGRVEFEQKQYADAADLLRRAITQDDSLREAHYYLGLTYGRMGRKP